MNKIKKKEKVLRDRPFSQITEKSKGHFLAFF